MNRSASYTTNDLNAQIIHLHSLGTKVIKKCSILLNETEQNARFQIYSSSSSRFVFDCRNGREDLVKSKKIGRSIDQTIYKSNCLISSFILVVWFDLNSKHTQQFSSDQQKRKKMVYTLRTGISFLLFCVFTIIIYSGPLYTASASQYSQCTNHIHLLVCWHARRRCYIRL